MQNDTTAFKTLAVLYEWFCERSGFPTTTVSDNGPQFISKDFASNGLAEKAVGTIQNHLKKIDVLVTPVKLYVSLKSILCVLGTTVSASTRLTPLEVIFKASIPRMFPQIYQIAFMTVMMILN